MSPESASRDARFVAERDAATKAGALATVYADGLFRAAENAGLLSEALDDLESIVEVIRRFPRFTQILESVAMDPDEKVKILDRVFAERIAKITLHFLKVTAQNGRLDLLQLIHQALIRLMQQRDGRVAITVTTAAPIGPGLLRKINDGLLSVVPGQPEIQQSIDPGLIGGMVVRVGDTIYDASVATQLRNMRQQLIDRSTHEVQSRRDRFRNTTGN